MTLCDTDELEPDTSVDLSTTSTLTTTLAELIAEEKGLDPLDPDFNLYKNLDTDALDRLFRSTPSNLCLQFLIEEIPIKMWKTEQDFVNICVLD